MLTLIFDTETSGLYDFKRPYTAQSQPHMIQLAAGLFDEKGNVQEHINTLVWADGLVISSGASNVHGLTVERVKREGQPIKDTLTRFTALAKLADRAVAFNFPFDAGVLQTAYFRNGQSSPLVSKRSLCAMRLCTDICRLPNPKWKGSWKWPKLTEAHAHFFGKPHDSAHDALADLMATERVLRAAEEFLSKKTLDTSSTNAKVLPCLTATTPIIVPEGMTCPAPA